MRAGVLHAFGGPEGLVIEEWPEPVPDDDEVLVRVRAVCVNRTDVYLMTRTNIGRRAELPHIGGVDPAGEVVGLGPRASGRRLGERVVARPMIPCLACRFCLAGQESVCERPQYVGVHRPGGFAEFVALPARALYPIPDGVSFESAAAMAHSIPVALHLLRAVGSVDAGDTVLVVGAAGGLGAACVQVARVLGARVLAAVSSREKVNAVLEAGADAALAYDPIGSLEVRVRQLSGGPGINVLVDNVGDPTLWDALVPSLDRGGRIISCGSHAGGRVTVDLNLFYRQQLRLISTAGTSDAEFREALDLVAAGRVRPLIHRAVPLSDLRSAFEELLARGNVGKIVIRVA
jgi:NADPH:quinone reductase